MNKNILIILNLLILCLVLTGCWSYREIDSLYIIAGIAIDKIPETDQYNITTELVNIKENELEKNFESILLENTGDSIADAVTNMIRVSGKTPYWAHATTVIISEEVAREGIMPFLDLFTRNQDLRLGINVYISKENSAKKILEVEGFSTDIRSYELAIMADKKELLIKAPTLKIYELVNKLSIPKVHTVLPTIKFFHNNGKNTNQLAGGAVFSGGKLVGFLDEEETFPYLFIKNQIKAGTINVKTKEKNPYDKIILDIKKNKTKLKPVYKNDKISFDIFIKTDTTIAELTTMTDYISSEGRKTLKKLAEQSLEIQIENHIKDIQKRFGFDIFGFGNIIRQRNPKLWKSIENDWDSIFKYMEFNVICDIDIKNSGSTLKPTKVVD